MRRAADALIVTLLTLGACSPEVTSPEGGAAVGKVAPKIAPWVVPDIWCPAAADAAQDTTATDGKSRPRAACRAPAQRPPPRSDSPTVVADSAAMPRDKGP